MAEQCLYVGGRWQIVENIGGLTYITGRGCPPPQQPSGPNAPPTVGALCPPPETIPAPGVSIPGGKFCPGTMGQPEAFMGTSELASAVTPGSYNSYTGPAYTGGGGEGGGLGETEETMINGEQGYGVIPFRANVHGCGCEVPGEPASKLFSWLPWITLAIAIYAATRDK